MFNLARGAIPAALTAAALAFAPSLLAADGLNLLVMGQDADLDSVERHSPIFDRVLQAIAGELRARGFEVYDETATTMDFYDQSRVRRSDAELISLARTVQIVPIDAVTAFEIHATTVPSVYDGLTDLRLRITGRVVNVVTGLTLGGYEVSYRPGELPSLPLRCHRDCQIAFVGDQAAVIARDVGAALAAQLAQLSAPTQAGAGPDPEAGAICDGTPSAFTLTFTGFTPEEMSRIGSFLTLFKGYAQHRPLGNDGNRSEVWYETCADAARLEANLRAVFEQTGMDVWLEADEHEFAAARIGTE